MSNESTLISKVWNFAHVLRDDGVGYGDYLVSGLSSFREIVATLNDQ